MNGAGQKHGVENEKDAYELSPVITNRHLDLPEQTNSANPILRKWWGEGGRGGGWRETQC